MIGSAKYSKDSPRVREWASRKEAPWHASAGKTGRHLRDRLEGSGNGIHPTSYLHIERSSFSLSWTVGVVFGTVERFLRAGEIELVISKLERMPNNPSDTLGAMRSAPPCSTMYSVFSIS